MDVKKAIGIITLFREDWDKNSKTANAAALDMAITALKEVQQYRAIGTVEECRAAVEKQTAKKGIRKKIKKGYNRGMHHYYCPVCYEKGDLRNKYNVGLYCSDCGQKLDWEDEE